MSSIGLEETLNMLAITIEQFTKEIKLDLEDENYDPMIGIGKSGVGKTMSIHELTQELGIGYCELRLVTMNEIDMLGIPKEDEFGRTTYASNSLLPDAKRDGERGILVLDEITSCGSTLRAAAYQLLDSKRSLGNYTLPPKWKVVALGNGPSDGGVFQGMEHAFLSRATCFRIEPRLEVWKKWAINNGVNSSVIAYLSFEPQSLHSFNPDEIASVFPCPRSWTALSKRLNSREKRNGDKPISSEDAELYAAGAIGAQLAPRFAAFYSYNSSTISPEDILSGKATADLRGVETQVVYLTIQSLIKLLKSELEAGYRNGEFTPDAVNKAVNTCKWLINIADYKLDYAITAIQDLVTNVQLFLEIATLNDSFDEKCPEFIEFATKQDILFQ